MTARQDNVDGIAASVYSGLGLPLYDYFARVLTNSITETYTFRKNGATGTIVAHVIIVYTDNTLSTISTVTKTA